MKKFSKLVCMVMAAMMCFTGCGANGQKGTQTETPATTTQNPQQAEMPQAATGEPQTTGTSQSEEGKEVTELSLQFQTGINNFSYKIFEQLENGKNIFISPYSMAIAISMLDNGADGETKEEMEKMLGIKDLEDWNACVKYYMSLNQEAQAKLQTANTIWLSDQIELSENADDFFYPVKQYYQADKNQADLTSNETMKQINQWVSDKTNGMIDCLLTEPLGIDTKMLLANAVYFKGEWKEKFDAADTEQEDFYGKDKTSKTDMMHQYDTEYKYIKKNGIRAIELPYANDKIVMDILLPATDKKKNEKEKSVAERFMALSEQEKTKFFAALSKQEEEDFTEVAIPKFKMNYEVENMMQALQQLGMQRAFADGEFEKIAKNLYVDRVCHIAKVDVDEQGTKAAAVTSIMANDAMSIVEEEKVFIANEPFIFVIRDVENDMILFMGSMQNCE